MSASVEEKFDEKLVLQLEADMDWLRENYSELAGRYEGKFVAIKEKQIVAEAEKFEELMRELESRGLDPRSLIIESFAPKSFACIL